MAKTPRRSKPTATSAAVTPPTAVDKSQHLTMVVNPDKTQDRMMSDMLVQGVVLNASATAKFTKPQYDDVSLTDLLASLKDSGEAVNRGDFTALESMLTAQAVTLNVVFGELTRRAALNVGSYHATMELYLRLALKAQSQSRATVETLALMKNPPVFARQANINNGGQQQVNNGPATGRGVKPPHSSNDERLTLARALLPLEGEGTPTLDDKLPQRTHDACMAGTVLAKE